MTHGFQWRENFHSAQSPCPYCCSIITFYTVLSSELGHNSRNKSHSEKGGRREREKRGEREREGWERQREGQKGREKV